MYIKFTAVIEKAGQMGEKTGWTYIIIPHELAKVLKPGWKKTFKVQGRLDAFPVKGVALLPIGGGDFMMPLNAAIRKGIKKGKGDELLVEIYQDNTPFKWDKEFKQALVFEKEASLFFHSLPKSHQRYFSKWISSAKTKETKANRISKAIIALERKQGYGEMLRALKKEKEKF